ncbi:MAG: hypothetical protein Hals2KO_14220 [Halioglobus sp.]
MGDTNPTNPLAFSARFPLLRSPAVAGATLAIISTALWAVLEGWASLLGAGSASALTDGVFVMLLMLQAGYYLAVAPLLRRAALRCIDDLQPLLLGDSGDLDSMVQRFSSAKLPYLRWTLPLGALITVVLQEIQLQRFSNWIASPSLALGELVTVLAAWLTWGLGLSAATLMITDAAAIRHLGRNAVTIDLMRLERLTAFSRYGLQLSGAVVGLMALWAVSLVLIDAFVGVSWGQTTGYVGLLMVAIYLCLAIAAFVYPQLGVRHHIRHQKERVCHQLTDLLPSSDQAVLAAGSDPERLAALLSSRNQIQAIPEWPAGQHTRVRLVAYLLVPLLSWSAAALVEEAVSRLIG